MKKKLLALLVCLCVLISATACGSGTLADYAKGDKKVKNKCFNIAYICIGSLYNDLEVNFEENTIILTGSFHDEDATEDEIKEVSEELSESVGTLAQSMIILAEKSSDIKDINCKVNLTDAKGNEMLSGEYSRNQE